MLPVGPETGHCIEPPLSQRSPDAGKFELRKSVKIADKRTRPTRTLMKSGITNLRTESQESRPVMTRSFRLRPPLVH